MYSRINKKYNAILAVGRQFMHLATKHGSIAEGLDELKKIAGSEHQIIISSLERVFMERPASDDESIERKVGPYGVLQKLISTIKLEGGNPINIFPGFDRMLFTINDQMRGLWVSIGGFFLYASFVLLVAALLFTVLLIFVLPQFQEMYSSFGGNLPRLTELFIKNDAALFYVLLLGLVSLIVFMLFTVLHVFNMTARLLPLSPKLSKIPFMRKLVASYNRLLALNYARLLLSSGLSEDRSLVISAEMASDNNMSRIFESKNPEKEKKDPVLSALIIAKNANNLESELDYQINDQNYQLINDFTRARQESMFIGHILLAIFVGLTVAAMYLPIFKMGEIG